MFPIKKKPPPSMAKKSSDEKVSRGIIYPVMVRVAFSPNDI